MSNKPKGLTEWEWQVCCHLCALDPCIYIPTSEETRVIPSLVKIGKYLGSQNFEKRDILVWSEVSLFNLNSQTGKKTDDTMEYDDFSPMIGKFSETEEDEKSKEQVHKPTMLLVCDSAHALKSATNIRALKETLTEIRGTRKTVFLIGSHFEIPEDLGADIKIAPFEMPTEKDHFKEFSRITDSYKNAKGFEKVNIDDTAVRDFARACAGLTQREAGSLLSNAIVEFNAIDNRAVTRALKDKAQIVQRSQALEYRTCEYGLDAVGGLENVKAWIKSKNKALLKPDAALKYGVKPPSGLLLIGVPGCGKSLTANALAGEWKVPLLYLSIGAIFGSLVGESESRLRQVFELAKAIGKCVVFIDEIEKGLGGESLDGGTTLRVMQALLTWLQEKPADIFVVATANDIAMLEKNPALLRKGRFDEIFFVDLPHFEARKDILNIHLKKCGHMMPDDIVNEAAKVSYGFSGSELEVAVQYSVEKAFNVEPLPTHPSREHLIGSIKGTKPLSQTMRESIDRLRQWCADERAVPAGQMLEEAPDNGKGKMSGGWKERKKPEPKKE